MASGMDNGLVEGYGQALFTAAQAEGALERVEDELFRVARTVEQNPELADRLTNPGLPVAQKIDLVNELLSGRAHPATTAAVTYVVQAGRSRQLVQIADEVVRRAAESRSRALAEVRSAVALDAQQRQRLAAALSEATGQQVELKVVIDPDVVGGVVAKIGDTVIDGSISARLMQLRSRLTGA